jgi:hypothetical protein
MKKKWYKDGAWEDIIQMLWKNRIHRNEIDLKTTREIMLEEKQHDHSVSKYIVLKKVNILIDFRWCKFFLKKSFISEY